ncbi:hypothetical protein A2U01_0086112, partial [Trifolium medium]|nr:hypothetical protein [Trifolium medium]
GDTPNLQSEFTVEYALKSRSQEVKNRHWRYCPCARRKGVCARRK